MVGKANLNVNTAINRLFIRIATRAESNSVDVLQRTFVGLEQIALGLERIDHQVIYGRRGTGKTHALSNLAAQVRNEGDAAIFVDLRKIGSNNGLYSDSSQPLTFRATRLLIDIVEKIHTDLLSVSIEDECFEALFPNLDALAEAATEVRVEGPISLSEEAEQNESSQNSSDFGAKIKVPRPSVEINAKFSSGSSSSRKRRAAIQRSGVELPRLLFGRLGNALEIAAQSISPRRIWILFDEWSSIPLELQPILADMLRRVFFTVRGLTVKIAAIERRSKFIERADSAQYIGLELGADTAAALNLDELLLATEAGITAQTFFAQLFWKHIAVLAEDLGVSLTEPDPISFMRTIFAGEAFAELVRAAEGIPRDALNIGGLAAGSARTRKIEVVDIKSAARKFYLQDKETGIAGNHAAYDLWVRLQREVVIERKSRTFLLRRNRDRANSAILDLYDARLIHLLQPGLNAPGRPGVGYDGYSVDYGSYVNLIGEEEVASIWDARSRPWEYSSNRAFLPDRFDESVIFNPAAWKNSRSRREKRRQEG